MPDQIRSARRADAAAIRDIYAPFVESTAVTFETEVPSLDAFEDAVNDPLYPWLVFVRDGEVTGYAKGSRFHERAAYSWSVEVTVYLAERARGSGAGKQLITSLLELLLDQGYANAFAGIALPNPASVGLFESLGFEKCALHRRVGYKLGKWHDVGWWQKALGPYPDQPPTVPAIERPADS
jgi:phosphinothricin acetyltransferase